MSNVEVPHTTLLDSEPLETIAEDPTTFEPLDMSLKEAPRKTGPAFPIN